MLAKQKTLKKVAKKRNLTLIEKKLTEELATLKLEGAQKIQEKMLEVNKPEYLQAKQAALDFEAE